VDSGLSLEQIKFRYAITGDNPPWKPLRAFDDGQRIYIQFPGGIAQGELPPLLTVPHFRRNPASVGYRGGNAPV
jgi:type IV secretion system protein VirB9